MVRKLLDELVVPDGERGAVDVPALHREEADPGEVPAVRQPARVANDRAVRPAIRFLPREHERVRARRQGRRADLTPDVVQHQPDRRQVPGRPSGIREPPARRGLPRRQTHAVVHRALRPPIIPGPGGPCQRAHRRTVATAWVE